MIQDKMKGFTKLEVEEVKMVKGLFCTKWCKNS